MPLGNPGTLSIGDIHPSPPGSDATSVEYQHYELARNASGRSLGIGRRTVPNPASQFSLSGAQFQGGTSAKAPVA